MFIMVVWQDKMVQKAQSSWNLAEAAAGHSKSVMIITGDSPRIMMPSNQDKVDPVEFPTIIEAKLKSPVNRNNDSVDPHPQGAKRKGSVFDRITLGPTNQGGQRNVINHDTEDQSERIGFKEGCFDSLIARRKTKNQNRRKKTAAMIQANLSRVPQRHNRQDHGLPLKNSFASLRQRNVPCPREREQRRTFPRRQADTQGRQRSHDNYNNRRHESPDKSKGKTKA